MTRIDIAVANHLVSIPLARIAHFTPSRNLPHIMADGRLRSVKELSEDVRACYTATDLQRLDGFPDRVCCSMQYPNGYYFEQAMSRPDVVNFPDWVCLFINKMVAATEGTLFCPRNAAADNGALCIPGLAGLHSCYAPAVTGQGGQTRQRGKHHDPGSPTDIQAEVLVTAPISLSDVSAIVVPTEEAARQEYGRLHQLGLLPPPHIRWVVCVDMFNKWRIASAVRNSVYLDERLWQPVPGAVQ